MGSHVRISEKKGNFDRRETPQKGNFDKRDTSTKAILT